MAFKIISGGLRTTQPIKDFPTIEEEKPTLKIISGGLKTTAPITEPAIPKFRGRSILGGLKQAITDIPAQLQDLLTMPSRLTGLPHPPMVSKLATETMPYLAKKAVTPIGEFQAPVMTPRNIKPLFTGKLGQIETTPVEPSPLDLALILGIPAYRAGQGVLSRLQYNEALKRELAKPIIESVLRARAGAIPTTAEVVPTTEELLRRPAISGKPISTKKALIPIEKPVFAVKVPEAKVPPVISPPVVPGEAIASPVKPQIPAFVPKAEVPKFKGKITPSEIPLETEESVRQAIKEGRTIPEEIMAKYPKLWPEWSQKEIGKVQQPKAGGMPFEITPELSKQLQKLHPDIIRGVNLVKDITVKDIHRIEHTYKKGMSIYIYEDSKTGKALVKNGKPSILQGSQIDKVEKAGNKWRGFLKPEEAQVEEVVKGGKGGISIDPEQTQQAIDRYTTLGQRAQARNDPQTEYFFQRAEELTRQLEDQEIPKVGDVKFSQYQLPGGENYREVLIKATGLPAKRVYPPDIVRAYNAYHGSKLRAFDLETKPVSEIREVASMALRGGKEEFDRIMKQYEFKEPFKSPHWDEPNVLAHIRMNDRTTPEGKKVLFIEEIQSDWATKGRQEGFQQTAIPRELKIEGRTGGWTIVDNAGNLLWQGSNKLSTESKLLELQTIAKEKQLKSIRGVPFHPLLKNWQEFTLKKILKYAIDNGYDGISWTTGEQQAERYDLSKVVDTINSFRLQDGTYKVRIYPLTQAAVPSEPIIKTLSEKELPDFVGKDVAEKIIRSKDNELILQGMDLKVGGEWAKNLYDRQIPNILKDLTKGEVGSIELGGKYTREQKFKITWDSVDRTFNVYDKEQEMALGNFKTKDAADKFIQSLVKVNGIKSTQPAIMITPEVRIRVIGQPMAGGMVRREYGLTKAEVFPDVLSRLYKSEQAYIQKAIVEGKSPKQIAKELDEDIEDTTKGIKWAVDSYRDAEEELRGEVEKAGGEEVYARKQELRNYLRGKLKPGLKLQGEYPDLKHLSWLFAQEGGYTPDELAGELSGMGFSVENDEDVRQLIRDTFQDEIQKKAAKFAGKVAKMKKYRQPKPLLVKQPKERLPSFGREWTSEQRKAIYVQALNKGFIIKPGDTGKIRGIIRHYPTATADQIKEYISQLTGQPGNPPLLFKLYGDIIRDTEVMKILNKVSKNWKDITELEIHSLEPGRIVEEVTGMPIWGDAQGGNILADNTFNVWTSADDEYSESLTKEINELNVNREGIKKGSRESAELQRKGEAREQLTPKEQKVADYLRKKRNERWKLNNEMRVRLGYKSIPYRENYWTHIKEFNLLHEFFKHNSNAATNVTFDQLNAIRNSDYTKGNIPFNKFAQKRRGKKTKFDAIGNFEMYMRVMLKEYYYTPPIKHARAFIKYALINQPNAYIALDRKLNTLKGKSMDKQNLLETVFGNRWVQWLNNRIAANYLVANLNFWLTNASNFTVSFDSLGDWMRVGMAKFLGRKEWRAFAFKHSKILRNRTIDPEVDPSTFTTTKKAASYITNLLEYNNVGSTFIGAYFKAIEELRYPQPQAILYADAIARRTQAGYKKYETTNYMDTNTGKILSKFQTWSFNMMNHVLYDLNVKGIPISIFKKFVGQARGARDKTKWGALFTLIVISMLVNWAYKKAGLRAPYGVRGFIPGVPFLTRSRYEEPPLVSVKESIKQIFTGKKPETRYKASMRATTAILPPFGGAQLGRFFTGRVLPEIREKEQEPTQPTKRFTGQPFQPRFIGTRFKKRF